MLNKMLKAVTAWLLALMLLCPVVQAERDAAWFDAVLHADGSLMYLLDDAQLSQIANLSSEEVHAIVEALFRAVAGVTEREEVQRWKNATAAEKETISAQNAAYRQQTLPLLMAVCQPGLPEEKAELSAPAEENVVSEEILYPSEAMAALAQNAQGQAFLAMLAPYGGTDDIRCVALAQAVFQRWLAEIDHDQLEKTNSHYVCWIYGPDSPIDYPIVQGSNNSYYLDHLFNRTSNPAGTLFMDYRGVSSLKDANTIVYGHHMRDGSMFHSLTEFDTEGYYDAHPFMLVVSKDTIWVVELFAGYVTDVRDVCYDLAISDEAEMIRVVTHAVEKSYFNAHVAVDCAADRLLTLSTCAYNFDNARCVVLGRLLPAWQRDAK